MLLIVKLVWFLLLLSIWQKTPCLKVQFRFVFLNSLNASNIRMYTAVTLNFRQTKAFPPNKLVKRHLYTSFQEKVVVVKRWNFWVMPTLQNKHTQIDFWGISGSPYRSLYSPLYYYSIYSIVLLCPTTHWLHNFTEGVCRVALWYHTYAK